MRYKAEMFDSEGTIAIVDENGDDAFYVKVTNVVCGPNAALDRDKRLHVAEQVTDLINERGVVIDEVA